MNQMLQAQMSHLPALLRANLIQEKQGERNVNELGSISLLFMKGEI